MTGDDWILYPFSVFAWGHPSRERCRWTRAIPYGLDEINGRWVTHVGSCFDFCLNAASLVLDFTYVDFLRQRGEPEGQKGHPML
jgi:hypothetical protein